MPPCLVPAAGGRVCGEVIRLNLEGKDLAVAGRIEPEASETSPGLSLSLELPKASGEVERVKCLSLPKPGSGDSGGLARGIAVNALESGGRGAQ